MAETDAEVDEPYWDEDDHDLLTFHESGVRLQKEIDRTRRAVQQATSAQDRAAAQARLDALQDAQARSSKTAAEAPGEQGFLAYRPPTATDS